MRFEELSHMMQKPDPKPDTYEAGMAQNQLLKIGSHAIRLHNMIDDDQEMESWVAKKIDLASNYVKSVHGYTAGSKVGTYDDDGMSEGTDTEVTDKEIKMAKGIAFDKRNKDNMSKATSTIEKVRKGLSQQPDVADALRTANEDAGEQALANDLGLFFVKRAKEMLQSMERPNKNDQEYEEYVDIAQAFKKGIQAGLDEVNTSDFEFSNNPFGDFGRGIDDGPDRELVKILAKQGYQPGPDSANDKATIVKQRDESVSEDAGEGHMSKSQLYATAKMAIELIDMINKGDDLEGWVQTKLNLAADYLQAVYHYEDYQKLNPYREDLDGALMQKHAGVIQKNLDEILARETKTADVDTKPGMMRILKKRVNEVEKEIAKENRIETNEAPPGMGALGTAATKVGSKILSKIPGMGQKAADMDSKLQGDADVKQVFKSFRDFAIKTGAEPNKPSASTVTAFLTQKGLPTTSELSGLQGDPMVSPKTLNTILTKSVQNKARGGTATRGGPATQGQAPASKGMSPNIKKLISTLTPQQKTQLANML